MDKYKAPAKTQRFELEIKRSRFITTVGVVGNKRQSKAFIQSLREEFPDANHHCWAIVAGKPDDVYQQDQSDDGEPKGTAGKPMLNVLQHSGLGNVVVVVTRYFGGIRLGAGGLVRAYTQSVSQALKQLETSVCHVREELVIKIPYSILDSLEHWLQDSDILIKEKQFGESIKLVLLVPASDAARLLVRLDDIGKGAVVVEGRC